MNSPVLLEINNIAKKYGKTNALSGISFKILQGESLIVMGPSGSGKSTLLRIISGLEVPDKGEVYIKGKLASSNTYTLPPHLRNLGMVFQTPALWPNMTVKGNILFGLSGIDKKEQKKMLRYLLAEMEIEHLSERYPEQLSGGEARRVSLARALAPKPDCLIMDEPLTNLDQALKDKLINFINNFCTSQNITVLFVTHDINEAEKIGSKILHFSGGAIIH